MAPSRPKGPKIANPAKAKGKSRASAPKAKPAAVPNKKQTEKTAVTKKTNKTTVKPGPSSNTTHSSPNTLFEDDDEMPIPPPSKRRKVVHTPTPEPEPEAPTNKYSSPLSSPEPEPPKKHRARASTSQNLTEPSSSGLQQRSKPTTQDANENVDNEVLANARDTEDGTDVDEDTESHGDDKAQSESKEDGAEDRNPDDAEGKNDKDLEDEDEDEFDLDHFKDPGATAYALSAALGFTTEAEKTTYERYLLPFWRVAHITPRAINPFLPIGPTLETAMRLDPNRPYVQQSAEAEIEELNEAAFTHTMQFYHDVVGFCPHLLKVIHAFMDDPGAFGALCKYMDQLAGAARRVDCNRVRTAIVLYIPDLPKNVTIKKEERGWLNEHTARLLCPQSKLKDFGKDWKAWSHKVKQGHIRITEFDLPSFLWDQSVIDPGDITVGLLRGPVLLSCFRIVFTGPRTGDSVETGMKPGKPCFMQMYNMQSVLAQMIAYIAVLVRFSLNSQGSWNNHDNDFNSKEFFNVIVSLFCSDEEGGTAWAVKTMEWWNLQILGIKPREFRGPSEDSEFTMIKAMFAARAGPTASGGT